MCMLKKGLQFEYLKCTYMDVGLRRQEFDSNFKQNMRNALVQGRTVWKPLDICAADKTRWTHHVNHTVFEEWFHNHYSDVIISAMVPQPFVQAHIKENTIVSRHWPYWGKSTSDQGSPQRASKWLNVSIWLRHHDKSVSSDLILSVNETLLTLQTSARYQFWVAVFKVCRYSSHTVIV